MASLQQGKPIQEPLPVANCQHDEHTSAEKHQEVDSKQAAVEKSENRLTEFYSYGSASQQYGKQTTVTGKTEEKGKKETSKELSAATYGSTHSTHMVSLKPMKAAHKIKEEKKKKKKKEKKKSKSKNKDSSSSSSSSSSSESEDDAPSKKKEGKEKKHK